MTSEHRDQTPARLSVILCSHNPRRDYLDRVLEGLRHQTLPVASWELLLVDSASVPPLVGRVNLDWHPGHRFLRNGLPGLTLARLEGIREAAADLLVFVDDDNVLSPDYLSTALRIGSTHPFLGVWGGSVIPVYETPPPSWLNEFEHVLSCGINTRDSWSNVPSLSDPWVIGAGMVIRKPVALAWAASVGSSPGRMSLGRRGNSLMGAEDLDIVLTACEMGQGRGAFKDLTLDHLIPPVRCTEEYIERLLRMNTASMEILKKARGLPTAPPPGEGSLGSFLRNLLNGMRRLRMGRIARMKDRAHRDGLALARGTMSSTTTP